MFGFGVAGFCTSPHRFHCRQILLEEILFMTYIPEYINEQALLCANVRHHLRDIPEDKRYALVRAITHATAQNIVEANATPKLYFGR